MAAVTPDIAADFLIEANELVERLGEQLVQLEHAPDDVGLLNAVFRAFHTVKGGAGFLGFEAMVDLCHAVEETLNAAREDRIALVGPAFDAAQRAVDALTDMLAAVSAGSEPEAAPDDLMSALHAAAAGGAAPAPAPTVREIVPPKAAAGDTISDDEFEALLDALHGGGAPAVAEPAAVDAAVAKIAQTPAPPPAKPAPAVSAESKPAAAKPPAAAEPEQTVRVDTRRLDSIVNLVGELVLARNRLKTVRERVRDEALDRAVSALDLATGRLQSAVMKTRMQPVGRVFARFPKLARDVARSLAKEVDLEVVGADTELDRTLVEALSDPLVHLVRNAIDHGIEAPDAREAAGKPRAGKVVLSAQQEGDHVAIEVRDDGGGMDPERLRAKAIEKGLMTAEAAARLSADECLQLVFLPGFSTKAQVTDLSGRGVGMDVVASRIRELSGHVDIQSEMGSGSRFRIRVPLTLAILSTLLVRIGGDTYALPLARVIEVLSRRTGAPDYVDGRAVLDLRQSTLPLLWLRRWLGLPVSEASEEVVVVLRSGDTRFGLVVDSVRGREDVVIKALPRRLRGLQGYAGATLIGDGSLALILDCDGIHRAHAGSSQLAHGR